MASVDLDVIALIIDNVKDRGTLFSLLTVDRKVFRYTCGVLYRDPLRFFRDDPQGDKAQKGILSLIRLLLDLSPATDDDANLVRSILGVPPKHALKAEEAPPAPPPPPPAGTMLNYLSFMQYVRWEFELDPILETLPNTLLQRHMRALSTERLVHSSDSFVRRTLTWCCCGHQLDQIRELEIEPDALERFIEAASQLERLRTIAIASMGDLVVDSSERAFERVDQLVQKLLACHGQGQIREFGFFAPREVGVDDSLFRWHVRISKRLLPLFPPDLTLVLPLRPMDSYLSRVPMLGTSERPYRWSEISRDYSDMSVGQLLQRCRALVRLCLDFTETGLGGPDVLAWAADEARERAKGRLSAPAVPLEELIVLLLEGHVAMDATRVLMDAVRGFGPSLVTLHVKIELSEDGDDDNGEDGDDDNDKDGGDDNDDDDCQKHLSLRSPWPNDEPLAMPRLENFVFTSVKAGELDPRLLQLCPNLIQLDVFLDVLGEWQMPPQRWPVLHLTRLTWLSLSGRAVDLFDPTSLHSMSQLRWIKFSTVSRGRRIPGVSRAATDLPVAKELWTYDWHLPALTSFQLRMLASSEIPFSFSLLRGCPKLKELCVEFNRRGSEPPIPLRVASVLPNLTEDIFPSLQDLRLVGFYSLEPEDFQALVGRALPSLRTLEMGSVSPCTTQQVMESTRHHSSLTRVDLWHEVPNVALQQQLGLERHRYANHNNTNSGQCIYTFLSR
ncbi:hypothetical protein DFQ27_006300, partial [Actinomortierella ambigua]